MEFMNNVELMTNVSKNIDRLREHAGENGSKLSVDKLCKAASIHISTINKIRKLGVKDARLSNVYKIAKVLNCTLDDLIKPIP